MFDVAYNEYYVISYLKVNGYPYLFYAILLEMATWVELTVKQRHDLNLRAKKASWQVCVDLPNPPFCMPM